LSGKMFPTAPETTAESVRFDKPFVTDQPRGPRKREPLHRFVHSREAPVASRPRCGGCRLHHCVPRLVEVLLGSTCNHPDVDDSERDSAGSLIGEFDVTDTENP
jgi:hypothetical protein